MYHSNRSIIRLLADGFVLKREDPAQKDLFIHLLDFTPGTEHNIFTIVNQLEIQGYETRIPDAIVYVNGLPLVVIEFKSAIKENTSDPRRLYPTDCALPPRHPGTLQI